MTVVPQQRPRRSHEGHIAEFRLTAQSASIIKIDIVQMPHVAVAADARLGGGFETAIIAETEAECADKPWKTRPTS